ncbi:MAG: hypothetical protein QOG54_2247 [Actinomycetota bacterium]|jgi:hypothetical protein|nr:hypothetical protein [Actinomycetota bacterium]
MEPDDPKESPKPPEPTKSVTKGPAAPEIEAGAIYIRWRDRLWQEQPDGSYLVWDEEARQWLESDSQPPRAGKTVSTRECPQCGRRVRTSLKTCPYCEFVFVEEAKPEIAKRVAKPQKVRKSSRRRQASPIAGLIVVVLLGGLVFGTFKYKQARDCTNWKVGVKTYTDTSIAMGGVPPGVTEQEFRELNEARFSDTKPGGCG